MEDTEARCRDGAGDGDRAGDGFTAADGGLWLADSRGTTRHDVYDVDDDE